MCAIGDVAGSLAGISREARREAVGVAQRIQPARIPVMTERPDRQNTVAALGINERVDPGKIVLAVALVDERPSDALAGNPDAEGGQEGIILVCMGVMLQLFGDVAAAAILPVERRAFEAGQEEGREDAVSRHEGTTRERPWRFACSTGGWSLAEISRRHGLRLGEMRRLGL